MVEMEDVDDQSSDGCVGKAGELVVKLREEERSCSNNLDVLEMPAMSKAIEEVER